MKSHFVSLLSCIGMTIAASSVVENATYDDLSAGLLQQSIGTYKNLLYNSFNLNGQAQNLVQVGGVASASPPQRILTSTQQQLTGGTAYVAVASPYKSVSLLDFFFGCAARTNEGAVSLATQCTITVAGFLRNNNQEVALASFTFTPPPSPLTPVPMIHAVLPSSFHQSLFNITFAQDSALISVLIDNMHYSVSK